MYNEGILIQSPAQLDRYIYLIGGVAIQYHWILDESVLYLGESEGRAKYKQDESNVHRYWTATHPMKIYCILYTMHS